MRVLYFGSYDRDYSRNRVLLKGLRENGVEVIECQDNSPGLRKYIGLFLKYRRLKTDYDIMLVGFLGHTIMPLARWLNHTRPIVFDAFISLYDSNVYDRRILGPHHPRAYCYRLLDRWAMRLADVVLFDTRQHIEYAANFYQLPMKKFRRLWVGTDDSVFYPRPGRTNEKLRIFFHGSFIPLQGVEVIIHAAKLLEAENVEFQILGRGQTLAAMVKLARELAPTNIQFIDRRVAYEDLPGYIGAADICLGIFGKTDKAKRVIPNKVYEYAACKKPIISSDTPALRELFDEADIKMIKPSEQALAEAVLELKNDAALRQRLAENAYNKFTNNARPILIGAGLIEIFKRDLKHG